MVRIHVSDIYFRRHEVPGAGHFLVIGLRGINATKKIKACFVLRHYFENPTKKVALLF